MQKNLLNVFSPMKIQVASILKKNAFLLLLFFLVGCHSPSSITILKNLSQEEEKNIRCFFNLLLFEEGGAFVALGSKPMCSASIIDLDTFKEAQKQDWESMNPDEKIAFKNASKELLKAGMIPEIRLNGNPYKGYLVWEQFSFLLDRSKFLMILQPQNESLLHPLQPVFSDEPICGYELIFVSVPKVVAILSEYYDLFKLVADMDFDPFSVVYELEDRDSIFWKRIFQTSNHVTKGLLFGFGRKNAALFDAQARHFNQNNPFSQTIANLKLPSSTNNFKTHMGACDHRNFSIPYFLSIDPTIAERYRMEKKKIKKYFKRGDLLSNSFKLLLIPKLLEESEI